MTVEATNGGNPPSSTSHEALQGVHQDPPAGPQLQILAVERIDSSQYQVREVFDETSLQELANSMKQVGLLHPILVRPVGDRFQIVAGERRLRAAKLLGWATIPALVQELSELAAAVRTMVENEQRVDANLLERARGYKRLIDAFSLSQDKVAEFTGVSQPMVSRLLALLDEPPEIQKLVASGSLSAAHVRTLDEIKDEAARVKAATHVAEQHLTVGETKKRTRKAARGQAEEHEPKETTEPKPDESVWGVLGHVFQVLRWIGLFRWLFKWLCAVAVRVIPGRDVRVGNLPPPDPVDPPDLTDPPDSKSSNPKAA